MSAIIIIDNKQTEVSDEACREIMRLRSENAALRIIQAQDKENYQCAMKASMAVEEQLKRENAALRELLREARDTVRASTVEDGISGLRREYRCGLYQRIKDLLGKEVQP